MMMYYFFNSDISELKINLKVAHIFRQNHQKLFSELNKLEKK